MKNMRRTKRTGLMVLMIACGVLGAGLTVAQAQRKKPVYYTVAANRAMHARLNEQIGSEISQVGDTFTSTLVDPVYSSGGVVLAPQGSTITGRVVSIQRAQKDGKPATLTVQFVSLQLPNGRRVAINGSLTDSSNTNEGTVTAKKTSKRNLKFIGGGAAGGAVIGAIAGGGKGALIGGGVGAVTGLIAKKLKKGHEVKVDSGTEFGVILNRAISLPRYGGV
jgi:hypothetical protein